MPAAISTLLLDGHGGLSEAQFVVLVLAVLVVAVALLSYFVVAPEYEKRLEKQYAAALAQHEEESAAFMSDSAPLFSSSSVSSAFAAERYLAVTRTKLSKHRSLGRWDIEAASSSDDDAYDHHLQRSLREAEEEDHAAALARERVGGDGLSMSNGPPRSMNSALHRSGLTEAQRMLLARRRKSESDALKLANVNRAEMLRRRVLLKKLEEEIKGAMKENDVASSASESASSASSSLRGDVRRSSNDALYLTEDKLRMLQEHPADCSEELSVLAAQTQQQSHNPSRDETDEPAATLMSATTADTAAEPLAVDASEIKQALQTLHDVLSFYLSADHRDMNKLTVFCNSLLAHDGLNHLRTFEVSVDQDVRTLANAIIEKAVPAIWH